MNKHASRGCIDESSTTGNMGEDLTMDVLIVRARITAMIQVFMMRPFPSLEINFQIYKKKVKKYKKEITIIIQKIWRKKNNNKSLSTFKSLGKCQILFVINFFSVTFSMFFCLHDFERYQGGNWFKPHGLFSNILIHFRLWMNFVLLSKKYCLN